METETKPFLKTELSQIQTAHILVEELKSSMDHFAYITKRYHVPDTLVLIYTQEDISQQLCESLRLSDVVESIHINGSYFNFIFLPFTDEVNSYTFVKHIEKEKLNNIKSFVYFKELEHNITSEYNFINSFLFEIEKKETFF